MKIGLLGCGTVGSGVVEIIEKLKGSLEIQRILVKSPEDCKDARYTCNYADLVNDPEIDIIVEVMGGLHPAREYILEALTKGKHVVSANKAVIAANFKEFVETAKAHHCYFLIEASTGGGIPWIKNLQRYARIDDIFEITGIFNGTTNYILDQMHKSGADFDAVLKEAQKLGYAEYDPSADIDGIDVQNKAIISAGIAHNTYVYKEEVPVFGIRDLTCTDIDYFHRKKKVCKLLAVIRGLNDELAVYVEPTLLNENSLEANVPDNFNICSLSGVTIGDLKFYGQGAGKLPTANAVVQDLLDIASDEAKDYEIVLDKTLKVNNENETHAYYVHTDKACETLQEISRAYESNADGVFYETGKLSVAKMHELSKQLRQQGYKLFFAGIRE
ncbi:homoserine dehydrogenase [Dielma fastidiosa]|uniref:homoserine dehydrogenase n=1 Tax=Dielma fastidiosa TaxID=1034346 RepID=UPI0035689002